MSEAEDIQKQETPAEPVASEGATSAAPETPPTPAAGPAIAIEAAVDSKEIDDGKAFAVLSYVLTLIGLPFFLVPLIMRNNEFSLFHAKQCLMLWLLGLVGGAACGVLALVCIGVILAPILAIFVLVLCVMGLIGASKGEMKPLPLIGGWGQDWFKGITKA